MMIEHVLDAVAAVCERIVIVGAHSLGLDREYPRIMDARPELDRCPESMRCLPAEADENGQYLVCPCDVPLITPHCCDCCFGLPMRSPLYSELKGTPFRTAAIANQRRLSADCGETARMSAIPAVWRLLQQLQPDIIEINSTDAFQLHNVNTRAELRQV
jgi:molybdopterin-guanine dinucleotide biosynthesis protein A